MVHLRICRIHIYSLEASPACVVMAVSLKHKSLSLAESERWASVWQSQGSRHGTSGMRCNDGVGWLTSFLGGGECRLVVIISGCAIQELRKGKIREGGEQEQGRK